MTNDTQLRGAGRHSEILDIVGIGFGPSNLAIAIAQSEMAPGLKAMFLERRKQFAWHETMLFDNATMQVNYLKDLATFRNPRSQFTFVNFLHDQQRLANFTNLQTLFPRRTEFQQYLAWCAKHFDDVVSYGTSAKAIDVVWHRGEELFRIISEGPDGEQVHLARNVSYCGGLKPRIPFAVVGEGRVSHGYNILADVESHEPGSHYAVVGAGQSAAEITEFLYQRGAKVTAVASRFGYMPADDSPFVNQIFDPDQVDVLYDTPDATRADIFRMHAATNYSGVDGDLVKSLYADWYHDKITGENRFDFRRMTRVSSAVHTDQKVCLRLQDALKDTSSTLTVDYLICATGFEPRSVMDLFSTDLQSAVRLDEASGAPCFNRAYALEMEGDSALAIYAPHMSERQHGLTATLLSNMAIRSGEIVEDILSRRAPAAAVAQLMAREVAHAG